MLRKTYEDGTHRMWMRVTDEVEAGIRHLAIDRKMSAEVLAGRLAAESLRRAVQKPKRVAKPR